ncbi:MAG: hypothetical protein OHK0047_29540 [Leptolyngbyaceae cyanobacterium]
MRTGGVEDRASPLQAFSFAFTAEIEDINAMLNIFTTIRIFMSTPCSSSNLFA